MPGRAFVCILLVTASVYAQDRTAVPELTPQGRGTAISFRVAFGGDGKWLAQSDRNALRIFDTATGKIARELTMTGAAGDGLAILAFAAHPREDIVVMCDATGALVAFNVATGGELWRTTSLKLPGSRWPLPPRADLRFSADGRIVNAAIMALSVGFRGMSATTYRRQVGVDGTVTADVVERVRGDTSLMTRSVMALPSSSDDGRWMYLRRRVKGVERVRVRDVRTGRDVGPEAVGSIVASNAATNRILLIDNDVGLGTLTLIEAGSGRVIASWAGGDATFSSDGSRILITRGLSALPYIASQIQPFWSLVDAESGRTLATSPPDSPIAFGWALSPDGQRIATVQQGKVVIADVRMPIEYTTITPSSAPLTTAGEVAALEQGDRTSDRAAEVAGMFRFDQSGFPVIALSNDKRWLEVRGEDKQVDTWDTVTGNRMPFRSSVFTGGPVGLRPANQTSVDTLDTSQRAQVDNVEPAPEPDQPVADHEIESTSCLTAASCKTRADYCLALGTATYETLLQAGIDIVWGGCSVSPDRKRAVVAGTDQRGKPLSRSLACKLLFRCSARLVVFDIARKTYVPLRDDGADASARFGFRASTVEWSPDSAFVLSQASIDGRLGIWDATTGNLIDVDGNGFRGVRSLGFLESSARLATSGTLLGGVIEVDVWDLHSRQRVARLTDVPRNPSSPVTSGSSSSGFAANEHAILGPGPDNTVWIRSWRTGNLVGHLRVLKTGDWLVTTPSGLFDGSPGGWRHLAWRVGDGVNVAPGELYFNEFYQPGLLADLLADRTAREVRAVADRDRRQPTLTVTAHALDARSAVVLVAAVEAPAEPPYATGSGVHDVRLFRNGVLVHAWRGAMPLVNGAAQFETRVPLVAGVNRFVVYAFNADNIKSADVETELKLDAPPREPTAYVLAVGINRYTNGEFDLKYAVPDATTFAADFSRAQQALGVTRVRVVNLLDGEATRQNILLALARLAGTQEGPLPADTPAALRSLERAQPEDTVVVYFAGHGVARDDRFHLIPSDLIYDGPRASAHTALDQLLARSISDRDLERAFEPIDARHLLLVIDACQSGQAIGADGERYGPMNSRGLAQLAYEKGMFVLTASQAYQAALESEQLGHGYLTYALVNEGLKMPVADATPADGAVTVQEWFDYAVGRVPQLQLQAILRAEQAGRLLTFGPGVREAGELQTPRAFSRRDDAVSLIVVRP